VPGRYRSAGRQPWCCRGSRTPCLRPDVERFRRRRSRVRRCLPGNAEEAVRSRHAVQVCNDRIEDRRSRGRHLGTRTHAGGRPGSAARPPRTGRALLQAGFLRSRPQLFRDDAEVGVVAGGREEPRRAIPRGIGEAADAFPLQRRGLRRHALSIERKPRTADLERAPVRPGGEPEPVGSRHRRLGRRHLGLRPSHLRPRPEQPGAARNPALGLSQPAVPDPGGERLYPRPDVRAAFPGFPGHLSGCQPEAVRNGGIHLGERRSVLCYRTNCATPRISAGGGRCTRTAGISRPTTSSPA